MRWAYERGLAVVVGMVGGMLWYNVRHPDKTISKTNAIFVGVFISILLTGCGYKTDVVYEEPKKVK